MLYLSQVLGRPIREVEGERVATLKDVIVRLGEDHPPVTGLVARYRRRDFFVPRARLARLDAHGARLNSDILDLRRFTRREGEVLLARDVLDNLPEEKAEDLLELMEHEEKADVEELLPYEDDEAGGLMTTEFVVLPKHLTVGEALASLREMAETPNMIYYLYVVEEEGSWKLCGVIALRSLILADPGAPLSEVMRDEFQFAHPKDPARDVAEKIAEYNLLALPVIDDAGDIAGIVTVDDAMEYLLPKDWRPRLPRVFG